MLISGRSSARFISILFALVVLNPGTFQAQITRDWTKIDKHVAKVPKKERPDLLTLTRYITQPFSTELEKVRAIYVWIGNNIKYDRQSRSNKEKTYNHDPLVVFEKKKGVCTGYANLFSYMTDLAGILSLPVSGYSRNTETAIPVPEVPDHVWNAVYIDTQWHLLDVTWDAGLWIQQDQKETSRKDNYFLARPLAFLEDHLPAMPMWQLLDSSVSIHDFIKGGFERLPPTDNYSNSIQEQIMNFVYKNPAQRRLFEYKESYRFHPTPGNGESMAHGLIDYAGILTDSLEILTTQRTGDSVLISITKEIVSLCQEAERHTSFHDWQSRMYADALVALTIYQYNLEIQQETPSRNEFSNLLANLEKAQRLIKNVKQDFWSRSSLAECQQLIGVIKGRMERSE